MMRLRSTLAFGMAVCLTAHALCPARAQNDNVDALRAALVFNIIRFVDFGARPQPLILCIRRGDRAGSTLADLNGRPVGDRTILFRVIAEIAMAGGCDIFYLGEAASLPLLARLQQTGLLLIGEGRDFVDQGGTIGLVRTGKQIRFEINARAARQSRIAISSKLMRLAARVQQ